MGSSDSLMYNRAQQVVVAQMMLSKSGSFVSVQAVVDELVLHFENRYLSLVIVVVDLVRVVFHRFLGVVLSAVDPRARLRLLIPQYV